MQDELSHETFKYPYIQGIVYGLMTDGWDLVGISPDQECVVDPPVKDSRVVRFKVANDGYVYVRMEIIGTEPNTP